MKLKTFKLFENEDMVRMSDGGEYPAKTVYPELGPDTYYSDDYLAFVETVKEWSMNHNQRVMWEIAYKKMYWDSFVKGERELTLIEMGDKLISVLHEDGKIIFAIDNEDRPVDLELVKDKI